MSYTTVTVEFDIMTNDIEFAKKVVNDALNCADMSHDLGQASESWTVVSARLAEKGVWTFADEARITSLRKKTRDGVLTEPEQDELRVLRARETAEKNRVRRAL